MGLHTKEYYEKDLLLSIIKNKNCFHKCRMVVPVLDEIQFNYVDCPLTLTMSCEFNRYGHPTSHYPGPDICQVAAQLFVQRFGEAELFEALL